MEISKIVTFDSAHCLRTPEWDEVKNKEVYGKCYNLHGHSYKLIVTIEGKKNNDGMIMNFNILKDILNSEVVELYDHKFLNECSDLKSIITTVENLAEVIWKRLNQKFSELDVDLLLKKIVLYETENSFVTIENN